ncbi:glutathione peroxidase [Granulicoccus phenolivorans]|uniref:glutathione peroxidase n=1 Tax=Granulicoccus phenolivorans TaxID=266854 RepID=UPI00040AD3AD|nr:glutathione peroxidase [Granulicoccus phenolivorans]
MTSLHDFSATRLDGSEQSLGDYKGKVALVVNTASACGLTPHYEGLQELYDTYADRGLVVLGFPCNQFGAQEPGTAEEIGAFCQQNYGVSFPMFAKVDVNGDDAHPVFAWLRSQRAEGVGEAPERFAAHLAKQPRGENGDWLEWNFTKFLVGKDGQVIERYLPTVTPQELKAPIEQALAD